MGKVHGSLARAGKVRGQTPKVAKQDKKKKPRGRAHKRLQHNRRFVTAALALVAMAQSEVLRCPHRLDTSRQGNIHKALALSAFLLTSMATKALPYRI
uniref:Uncharacterized protein n=1 Tax=Brassica campestris TaxID=3711 RepID=M4FD47_BRACM